MELYDALESSGSYSKAEITERVDKYRDKLMQVYTYVYVCHSDHSSGGIQALKLEQGFFFFFNFYM